MKQTIAVPYHGGGPAGRSGDTSALLFPFHLFFLEFTIHPPIGIARETRIAVNVVMHPVIFKEMAGAAFLSPAEIRPSVFDTDVIHMRFGFEVFMDMATLTILGNNPVAFGSGKFPLESAIDRFFGTTDSHHEHQASGNPPPGKKTRTQFP